MTRLAHFPAALAAAGVLAACATPAAAAPVKYTGTTSGGDKVAFTLAGGKARSVKTMLPTVCVPTEGTPRAGTDFYEPSRSQALGAEQRSADLQDSAMHYDQVTKNYHFTAKRTRSGAVKGKLHMNFSFQTLGYDSWGMHLVTWICQGDGSFKARPKR